MYIVHRKIKVINVFMVANITEKWLQIKYVCSVCEAYAGGSGDDYNGNDNSWRRRRFSSKSVNYSLSSFASVYFWGWHCDALWISFGAQVSGLVACIHSVLCSRSELDFVCFYNILSRSTHSNMKHRILAASGAVEWRVNDEKFTHVAAAVAIVHLQRQIRTHHIVSLFCVGWT